MTRDGSRDFLLSREGRAVLDEVVSDNLLMLFLQGVPDLRLHIGRSCGAGIVSYELTLDPCAVSANPFGLLMFRRTCKVGRGCVGNPPPRPPESTEDEPGRPEDEPPPPMEQEEDGKTVK